MIYLFLITLTMIKPIRTPHIVGGSDFQTCFNEANSFRTNTSAGNGDDNAIPFK